jgi:hypothetical protein
MSVPFSLLRAPSSASSSPRVRQDIMHRRRRLASQALLDLMHIRDRISDTVSPPAVLAEAWAGF